MRLQSSAAGAVAVAMLHVASLAVLGTCSLPLPVAVAIGVVLVAHGIYAARRLLLRTPAAIVGVDLGPGPACRLETQSGSRFNGRITDSTVVTGSLVVVSVRSDGGTRIRVPVLPGMASPGRLRELRVRLRWDRTSN